MKLLSTGGQLAADLVNAWFYAMYANINIVHFFTDELSQSIQLLKIKTNIFLGSFKLDKHV